MNSLFFSSSPSLGLFLLLVLVLFDFPLSLGNPAELYKYNTCSQEFNCGNITGVSYPFWGFDRPFGCGLLDLQLNCQDGIATIEIKGVDYRVLSFNKGAQTLRIARQDYLKGICSPLLVNSTLDPKLFDYAAVHQYVTFFYGCPSSLAISVMPQNFSCSIAGIPLKDGYFVAGPQPQGPGACNVSVFVPILPTSILEEIGNFQNSDQLIEGVIGEGIEVRLNVDGTACSECLESKGVCAYDLGLNQTTCYCKDQLQASETCASPTGEEPSPESSPPSISAGVAGIIVVFAVICCLGRKCLLGKTLVFWKKDTEDHQNVEAFVRNYGSLAPKRYKYSVVKKMTNSFTCKLGQGGFGCVYQGKLPDGRQVAVKLLSESKGNGEEFINEVASVTLIYEFMPNGSLDKFIYQKGSPNANLKLEWKTMYQIAVGIARGLEYLYRGCNTRILHFDIKPHNILLDEEFYPKISDFGLAKLCERKESMVSMAHARGTAGYVAPEVYCRNFGGVSHKSDVYSYGMLVLEMIGGRKNIDAQVSHTSQIHFPTWIYKQLQPGEDLILHGITNEEEEETARKMVLVSLWCIQLNPSDRPSIDKVVEMLEGSLQSLEIPPNPFMFPTQNAAQDPSTSS
ncbi:hypothetical protein PVL29_018725 [Vitis rotundifolia]|uniref:non-specific serine/threonine protein kinase n=1 Tax=Vitis rotundifolia TaxID=103349 RepID=A0AA39DFD1_VITRO|nr:hypothetical protein PVL29_018725 [Vitis rotundifolia]